MVLHLTSKTVVTELLDCGARRLVRVGSSAAMSPALHPGSVLIVTGAVSTYMPVFRPSSGVTRA